MTPFEINDALEHMTVIVDTREQPTARLKGRLRQMGCPNERRKLDFGDYSAFFAYSDKVIDLSQKCVVERKMSLAELCQCYCQGRDRFTREFERAFKAGARVYLLVEDATWEHVYAGAYRSQMTPQSLVASMCAWMARYDCHLVFCRPETSGKLIKELLYREGKERMERGDFDA